MGRPIRGRGRMTFGSAVPASREGAADCLARRPERLALHGLRGWLWGYATGDIACWEAVWNHHARELGPASAKAVVGELGAFARVLRCMAGREITCYPPPCRLMCRDECLAMALVAGCQSEAWAAARTAARALVGPPAITPTISAARGYAEALTAAEQVLDAEPLIGGIGFDAHCGSGTLN